MTNVLQQQVFALDAKFNSYRGVNTNNFRTLYIRRRNQLQRETNWTTETWKQYIKLRSLLLQQKYGVVKGETLVLQVFKNNNTIPVSRKAVTPTKEAVASRAIVGGTTIAENYAFVGVQHIFDQHAEAVTMVKFANNDRSRLCCSSKDQTLSICDVSSSKPLVVTVLKGHTDTVTGFDWSIDNDMIVSSSLDGSIRVWKVSENLCLRIISGPNRAQLICCIFNPVNNNLILTGDNRGELKVANVSTGRFLSNNCKIGGTLLSITSDTNGRIFWVGNNQGEITSVLCELNGNISKLKRISLRTNAMVTNLSYRAWISREARNPLLLVNATDNSLYLFSVYDQEGGLQLRKKFQNKQQKHIVRSTFCPLMSFRQGSCVVTGSENGNVYFIDVERTDAKAIVNILQGHSSPVLGISFNYDESLLATSDLQGLVILWKKDNILKTNVK